MAISRRSRPRYGRREVGGPGEPGAHHACQLLNLGRRAEVMDRNDAPGSASLAASVASRYGRRHGRQQAARQGANYATAQGSPCWPALRTQLFSSPVALHWWWIASRARLSIWGCCTSISPRSHRANVLVGTPSSPARSRCVMPIAVRRARNHSLTTSVVYVTYIDHHKLVAWCVRGGVTSSGRFPASGGTAHHPYQLF